MSQRADHLGSADCTLRIEGHEVGLELALYGRRIPDYPGDRETPRELGGFVIDRIELCGNDISSELPPEAMEHLTTYINEAHK